MKISRSTIEQSGAVRPFVNLVVILLALLGAQKLSAQEFVPTSPTIVVNDNTPGVQGLARIAAAENGSYAVAFADDSSSTSTTIWIRLLDARGVPTGSSTKVNDSLNWSRFYPDVAALSGSSGWVVVWESFSQDGSGKGVFGQRVSPTGVRIGDEFPISQTTSGDQKVPRATGLPGGGFAVVWTTYDPTFADEVALRLFDNAATPVTNEIVVNAPDLDFQDSPSVESDGAGNIVVVWDGVTSMAGEEDIFARRYDASGIALGSQFTINTQVAGRQERPDIAVRPDGQFVIAWQERSANPQQRFLRVYNADGTAFGPPIQTGESELGQRELFVAFPTPDLLVTLSAESETVFEDRVLTLETFLVNGDRVGDGLVLDAEAGGGFPETHFVVPTEQGGLVVWGMQLGDPQSQDMVGRQLHRPLFADGFESGDTLVWN